MEDFLTGGRPLNVQSKLEITQAVSGLEEKTEVDVILGSKEKYDAEIERMLLEASWVKLIHKHISLPWFLYSYFPDEQFFKIREEIGISRLTGSSPEKANLLAKRNTYLTVYKNKEVQHIMLRASLDGYYTMLDKLFGKDESKKMKNDIVDRAKSMKNVQILVLDKLFTPFSTYITDKEVIVPMFFDKKENRMLKMRGKQIIKTYQDFFEEYKKEARSLLVLRG